MNHSVLFNDFSNYLRGFIGSTKILFLETVLAWDFYIVSERFWIKRDNINSIQFSDICP